MARTGRLGRYLAGHRRQTDNATSWTVGPIVNSTRDNKQITMETDQPKHGRTLHMINPLTPTVAIWVQL